MTLGHCIQLQNTSIVARKSGRVVYVIRDVTGIEHHANNINRQDGFCLSRSWKLLIRELKEQKQVLSKNMTLTIEP
jgi:hypothetical protein